MSVYNELCLDISKEREKRSKLLRALYSIIISMVVTLSGLCIILSQVQDLRGLAILTICITASIAATIVALSVALIKIYFTLEHEHILLERLSIVRQTKIGNTPVQLDKSLSNDKQ